MQLHSLSLTDFAGWKHLSLGNLSGCLNVLHGPNEVGKTTLLRFLREMFYGQVLAREEDLRSFLLPRGRCVGICDVETPTGRYRVERTFCLPKSFGVKAVEHVAVERLETDDVVQQDSSQGVATLQVLLSGVDEAIYRNVFAFGIDEIERLALLGQTEAGSYLYDLSAGVDRVSLAAVFRALRIERESLLDPVGDRGEIPHLLAQEATVVQQLEVVAEEQGRYRRILSDRSRLETKIEKLLAVNESHRNRLRVADLAATVRPIWETMQQAKAAFDAMGLVVNVSDEALARLQQVASKKVEFRQRIGQLGKRLEKAKLSLAETPLRKALIKNGPHLDALLGQRDWVESRVAQIDRLQKTVAAEQPQIEAETLQLGQQLRGAIPRLRPAARGLKKARVEIRTAEARALGIPTVPERASAEHLTEELAAVDKLCSDLRRRIQLDQRLQRLNDTKQELDLQREGLLDEKVLSPRVLLVSGGIFSFGVMLAFSGIFLLSLASVGGALLTLVGIAGSVAGGCLKRSLGQAQQREWEAVQRQTDLLAAQRHDAEAECRELDLLFAEGRGPFAVQLRELDKRKIQLQQQLSEQEANAETVSKADAAADALQTAKAAYREARQTWYRALHAEGLPAKLSPAAVRRLAARCREESEIADRTNLLRTETDSRVAELDRFLAKIDALLELARVEVVIDENLSVGHRLLAMMDALESAWQSQQILVADFRRLRGERWGLERRIRRCFRHLQRLDEQQSQDLEDLGLSADEDLEKIALRSAEASAHQATISNQHSRLVAACDGICDLETLQKELDGVTEEQLDAERLQLEKRCVANDEKLLEYTEQRGRLGEQLLNLASDRRDLKLQLELTRIRQRISQSISRWLDLACTSQLLDSIRRCYEQQRQPAALQEASLYLERITEGRYRRIWTRLDEETLCVENAEGHHKSVAALSRGTREPLMLALRLALVSQYARRGIRLPIILDEVLVHFDVRRGRAAAELLKDFASAGGHQIFMLTCHKHLVSLFTELGADVRMLPDVHAQGKAGDKKQNSKAQSQAA